METLRFMFAVGIECSCPVIAGNQRVDQLRDTGHYEMWQTDLRLVRELGLRYLRYGPPIYKIFKGKNDYDWSVIDPIMAEMRRLGVIPERLPHCKVDRRVAFWLMRCAKPFFRL